MTDQIAQLTEALRGTYDIERQVGSGGMATVFLARDLKHGRQVAIKVLRPELSASVGTDRFLREIEMAARLQHPHILPVYDSGAAAGVLYYVMPFVEGESLRDRLDREGQLPLAETVRLAREVASALDYAHTHHVVHRDIKPENILLFGGHAVVADFGVARAVEASGPNLTGMGIAIGTPAYMSPEQATASADVDGRSDQYSLAAVVYEMLAGERAFAGPNVQSVLTRSISGPRPRVRARREEVPVGAEGAIVRALDTDPAQRFPSVGAFAEALAAEASGDYAAAVRGSRLWMGVAAVAVLALVGLLAWSMVRNRGTVVSAAQRIAVLPFRTSGSGVDVLGEGLVDLLSTNLDGVGGIQTVEPRTVLQRWREHGSSADLDDALAVGRDVDASAVLLGSVVSTGASVRLAADLYDGAGAKLGHAQVDGPADSVLALVDELSLALMREVWRSNEPIPSLRVAGLTTSSPAAMRAYLRGEQFYRESEWDSAAAAFRSAVAADSSFAMAHYRLAMVYGWTGNANSAEASAAGEAAVRYSDRLPADDRALVLAYRLFQQGRLSATDSMLKYTSLHPDDPDGWYLLGESRYHTRQLSGSTPAELREPFDRVLALDSSLTPAAIHPLETALANRDQAMYDRYMHVLERAGADTELARFRPAGALVFAGEITDSVVQGFVANARGDVINATMVGLQVNRDPDETLALGWRLGASMPPQMQPEFQAMGGLAVVGMGRLDSARAIAQALPPQNDMRSSLLIAPVLGGFAPRSFTDSLQQVLDRQVAARGPSRPLNALQVGFQNYFRAMFHLGKGDPDAARPYLDRARAADSIPPFLASLIVAAGGWYEMERGDTAAGLATMTRGLNDAGSFYGPFLSSPIRLRRAMAMSRRPATRDEGIKLLLHGFESDPHLSYIAVLEAARALESAGRRDEAEAAYARFLQAWRGADPALQPIVEEARRELAELQRATG